MVVVAARVPVVTQYPPNVRLGLDCCNFSAGIRPVPAIGENGIGGW